MKDTGLAKLSGTALNVAKPRPLTHALRQTSLTTHASCIAPCGHGRSRLKYTTDLDFRARRIPVLCDPTGALLLKRRGCCGSRFACEKNGEQTAAQLWAVRALRSRGLALSLPRFIANPCSGDFPHCSHYDLRQRRTGTEACAEVTHRCIPSQRPKIPVEQYLEVRTFVKETNATLLRVGARIGGKSASRYCSVRHARRRRAVVELREESAHARADPSRGPPDARNASLKRRSLQLE
jgi:hypothetical protein